MATERDGYLIVGIGASAGGLDAISELLSHIPSDIGMAFVVVQHLAPDQESLLDRLLSRVTTMPVETAADGMGVEPNQVYVIPPNADMTIAQGQLRLGAIAPGQSRSRVIDLFFESLAADQARQAIAVVLSGSNNDGAQGIEAIHQAGGLVFAQDPTTAEFDAMPAAAMATGQVDFVQSPTQIAEALVNLSRQGHPPETLVPEPEPDDHPADLLEDNLATLLRLIQQHTGVDFTHYKPNTFQRRLQRRLALLNCRDLAAYIQYLQDYPTEIQTLCQDVLITVTSFFRDEDVFAALQGRGIPALVQQSSAATSIRVWVPGCATGEEAYSLAICLLECLDNQPIGPQIQIFGTDISDQAIETARKGIYRENQMETVSPERRRRFFNEVEGGYQIKTAVRELCIFARQDLGSDPPFSDIDLLSCRNVLIYFDAVLQRRVLSFFHFSLKPTGFLILGNSESLGDTSDLFESFDIQTKIYTRLAGPSRLTFDFISSYYRREPEYEQQQGFSATLNRTNLQQWADQIVLSRYGPVGVIVNEQMDILQFRGDTSAYLRIPPGEPTYNLLKLLRPSLLVDLRTTLETAKQRGIATRSQGLILPDSASIELSLEVIPFHVSTSQERCYLVLFERETPEEATNENAETTAPEDMESLDPEIVRLRRELATNRQDLLDTQTLLQLTVEEKESTNQQLIAANEEILSSNEELKSANEELQTAKEEIQSANEELQTTNEELHQRNLDARRANDDLLNLLNHINIPILMLSDDLRIRRFTPAAQGLFNLISSDLGRPISDLRFDLEGFNLETLVTEVTASLMPVDREVQDQQGHWHMLRIRPYRTLENQISGAIVALVGIDDIKQTEQNLRQTQAQLEIELAAMQQVQDLSLQLFSSLDLDQALLEVLKAAMALHKADMGMVQLYNPQQQVLEIVVQQGLGPEVLTHFQTVRAGDGSACSRSLAQRQRVIIEDVESDPDFTPHRAIAAAAGFRAVQSTPLINRQGELLGILSTQFRQPHRPTERELRMLDMYGRLASEFIDLIQMGREQQLLTERERAAQEANASKDEFLSMLSHELRTPLTVIYSWIRMLEYGQLDEETQQQAISAIHESTVAQIKLIEDLLDVSRIVQSRFQIAPEPSNLGDLLQQAITQLQPQLAAKALQLVTELQPCPEPVNVDPQRMVQVFWNLLSNAIKFTYGGGTITVRLVNLPAQLQIQVSDTGHGIGADILPHVFEQFRQADSSDTRQERGLGLGLFLVKSIVEAHGGTVTAESPGLGEGATFKVTLPKDIAEVEEDEHPTSPATDLSLQGITILFIEDDAMTSTVIALALRQFGATVRAVGSAPEALESLARSLPDIIVSDVGLPEVNGYELMRQIRTLPPDQGGQLPGIALSGYADQQSVNTALEAGFQAHLSKPADIEELATLVYQLVYP
jgi:two-component system CheB/CheR fusion protein